MSWIDDNLDNELAEENLKKMYSKAKCINCGKQTVRNDGCGYCGQLQNPIKKKYRFFYHPGSDCVWRTYEEPQTRDFDEDVEEIEAKDYLRLIKKFKQTVKETTICP